MTIATITKTCLNNNHLHICDCFPIVYFVCILQKNSLPYEWIPRQISREKPISHESRFLRYRFSKKLNYWANVCIFVSRAPHVQHAYFSFPHLTNHIFDLLCCRYRFRHRCLSSLIPLPEIRDKLAAKPAHYTQQWRQNSIRNVWENRVFW